MSSKVVKEAYSHLKEQQISYVASCLVDQPYVRAMMLIYKNNKFYYATGTTDTKVEQLTQNPNVEICVLIGTDDKEGSLRIRGESEFIVDPDIREDIHGCIGFIQSFWSDPQDPGFTLIEVKPSSIEYMKPGMLDIERVKV